MLKALPMNYGCRITIWRQTARTDSSWTRQQLEEPYGLVVAEVQVGPDPDAVVVAFGQFAGRQGARDAQHAPRCPAVDVLVDRRLEVLLQLRLVEGLQRARGQWLSPRRFSPAQPRAFENSPGGRRRSRWPFASMPSAAAGGAGEGSGLVGSVLVLGIEAVAGFRRHEPALLFGVWTL